MGTGTKEDEPGRVWAAGCHHVTSRSRLACVFESYKPFISLIFHFFFRVALSRGYGGPPGSGLFSRIPPFKFRSSALYWYKIT